MNKIRHVGEIRAWDGKRSLTLSMFRETQVSLIHDDSSSMVCLDDLTAEDYRKLGAACFKAANELEPVEEVEFDSGLPLVKAG